MQIGKDHFIIMSRTIEKAETQSLPLVVLSGLVAFPGVTIACDIQSDRFHSLEGAQHALAVGSSIVLVSEVLPELDGGEEADPFDSPCLYDTGTVASIREFTIKPDGTARLVAEGLCRAHMIARYPKGKYTVGDIMAKTMVTDDNGGPMGAAYLRECQSYIAQIVECSPMLPAKLVDHLALIRNPGLYADFVAYNILVEYRHKIRILSEFDPMKRIETLLGILAGEVDILNVVKKIQAKVQESMDLHQREYYLREELEAIHEELGDQDDYRKLLNRLEAANPPAEIADKLRSEIRRLSKMPSGSAEASVLNSYADYCIGLPWNTVTVDRADVAAASAILEADHYGMEKIKERILEFIAVKQRSPELNSQILCLVGPPGVGKTSIAASVARALGRKYARVSLGGVRDEADIRGHRKTYIGSMPGRIIAAIEKAEVLNPLLLLDEIDKVTRDAHGDPASALLEVLDPEQNKYFEDHYLEFPFDLSQCLFIATANTTDTIPKPLLDRMEVIELPAYTRAEKMAIAKAHLIPKQRKHHGLRAAQCKITDEALTDILDYYTREAGVRNLERTIATLCRKAVKVLVENPPKKSVTVDRKRLPDYLGSRKYLPEHIAEADEIGVVNGLAYTSVGGDLLRVEVAVLDGTGKLELTGSLGDVMKESAHAALTYTRSIAAQYGIPTDFYQKKDIHIHVPEGAVPKDGPSAGVTIMTALVSALSGIPIRRDVAMTGEITLRGHVLAIGGLKEKTMAAYAAGVRTVLIPADNVGDLDEIDTVVREALEFIPCRKAGDVLAHALAEG